jgi:hypothetical protein
MRILPLILCILLVLTLFGCTKPSNFKEPVTFYYCANTIDYQGKQDVFCEEHREVAGYTNDLVGLLNLYLRGSNCKDCYNPFPIGSSITGAKREGNVLTLHLNEHFGRLTLEKLSLAIACLAMTTFEYTAAPVLLLIPDGTFIDGSTYKTLTADSFLYSDQNTNYSFPE